MFQFEFKGRKKPDVPVSKVVRQEEFSLPQTFCSFQPFN